MNERANTTILRMRVRGVAGYKNVVGCGVRAEILLSDVTMTIAAFYFSVVVGVVLSSPAPLLQRNTRNVQEVAVDVCSSNENWLGVDAGQHGVESDLLSKFRNRWGTC